MNQAELGALLDQVEQYYRLFVSAGVSSAEGKNYAESLLNIIDRIAKYVGTELASKMVAYAVDNLPLYAFWQGYSQQPRRRDLVIRIIKSASGSQQERLIADIKAQFDSNEDLDIVVEAVDCLLSCFGNTIAGAKSKLTPMLASAIYALPLYAFWQYSNSKSRNNNLFSNIKDSANAPQQERLIADIKAQFDSYQANASIEVRDVVVEATKCLFCFFGNTIAGTRSGWTPMLAYVLPYAATGLAKMMSYKDDNVSQAAVSFAADFSTYGIRFVRNADGEWEARTVEELVRG